MFRQGKGGRLKAKGGVEKERSSGVKQWSAQAQIQTHDYISRKGPHSQTLRIQSRGSGVRAGP